MPVSIHGWTKERKRKMRQRMTGKNNPQYGKPKSKEHREKISLSLKGRFLGENHPMWGRRGKNNPRWGIEVSQETRKKLSEATMGKKNHNYGKSPSIETRQKMSKLLSGKNNPMFGVRGESAPSWKGGISEKLYPTEWTETLRESIRQRDSYVCLKCHIPQRELLRKLSVHHIDYDKENLNPKNLISLCGSCNTQVNYNREYWKQYFIRRLRCLYNTLEPYQHVNLLLLVYIEDWVLA